MGSHDGAAAAHGAALHSQMRALLLSGSGMKSVPRLRKPWLRVSDTPQELLRANGADAVAAATAAQRPTQSHLAELQQELRGICLAEVGDVHPDKLAQLEASFLRSLQEAGDAGVDLAFFNSSQEQAPTAHSAQSKPIPGLPLNLIKARKTQPLSRKMRTVQAEDSIVSRTSKEDLQPWLGAKLKKNLGKLGLVKQQLSLQRDEWDDAEVVDMLGCNYASKEQERRAKFEQWYNKNLSADFVKKRKEALMRETEIIDAEYLKRLSSHGRVNVVTVATPDKTLTSETEELLSRSNAQLLHQNSYDDDMNVWELLRAREHKVPTLRGKPISTPRTSLSLSRSSVGHSLIEPNLVPNHRDRLRQRTRFLQSRGKIHKIGSSRTAFNRTLLLAAANTEAAVHAQTSNGSLHSSADSVRHDLSPTASLRSPRPPANSPAWLQSPAVSRPQSRDRLPTPGTRADDVNDHGAQFRHDEGDAGAHFLPFSPELQSSKTRRKHRPGGAGGESPSAEVSSWRVLTPPSAMQRYSATGMLTELQEQDKGRYVRSPTGDYDIYEADLLREIQTRNITPADRPPRHLHVGRGRDQAVSKTSHKRDARGEARASAEREAARDRANAGKEAAKFNVSPEANGEPHESPVEADSPATQLKTAQQLVQSVVNEGSLPFRWCGQPESLLPIDDGDLGNCF